eukprot:7391638-Prymnesium_polylepis.5
MQLTEHTYRVCLLLGVEQTTVVMTQRDLGDITPHRGKWQGGRTAGSADACQSVCRGRSRIALTMRLTAIPNGTLTPEEEWSYRGAGRVHVEEHEAREMLQSAIPEVEWLKHSDDDWSISIYDAYAIFGLLLKLPSANSPDRDWAVTDKLYYWCFDINPEVGLTRVWAVLLPKLFHGDADTDHEDAGADDWAKTTVMDFAWRLRKAAQQRLSATEQRQLTLSSADFMVMLPIDLQKDDDMVNDVAGSLQWQKTDVTKFQTLLFAKFEIEQLADDNGHLGLWHRLAIYLGPRYKRTQVEAGSTFYVGMKQLIAFARDQPHSNLPREYTTERLSEREVSLGSAMLCNILRKLANVPILFSSYPKCGDNGLIKLRTQLEYLACVAGAKPYDWMVDESNSTILTLCKGISSVLGQDSALWSGPLSTMMQMIHPKEESENYLVYIERIDGALVSRVHVCEEAAQLWTSNILTRISHVQEKVGRNAFLQDSGDRSGTGGKSGLDGKSFTKQAEDWKSKSSFLPIKREVLGGKSGSRRGERSDAKVLENTRCCKTWRHLTNGTNSSLQRCSKTVQTNSYNPSGLIMGWTFSTTLPFLWGFPAIS